MTNDLRWVDLAPVPRLVAALAAADAEGTRAEAMSEADPTRSQSLKRNSPRELIERAAVAIHDQEQDLVDAIMGGTGGLPGLGQLDTATVREPLGIENCVRASASHYNTRAEVEQMLATVNRLAGS